MNKNISFFILAGVAIIFLAFKKTTPVSDTSPVASTSAYTPAQPSQMFPVTGLLDTRADNANQPWYLGPQISGPAGTDESSLSLNDQVGDTRMAEIWSGFDDLYGSSAEGSLSSPDRIDAVTAKSLTSGILG